jgi:hypothetical protein
LDVRSHSLIESDWGLFGIHSEKHTCIFLSLFDKMSQVLFSLSASDKEGHTWTGFSRSPR